MSTSSPRHKVIGLVSGGKDSCFNLLHCVANGHDIVALATLTPDKGTDELDSHLYQSVGTDLPPLIAESMGIPHYSRVIKGKAVAQGPEYGDRTRLGKGSGVEGDETEDLYRLLVDVMTHHPEATAISTGAILSTYQRLRIEHVAGRLGLVSLAYLWQMPQLPLLEQMQACGMEVILVKVAGVGLGKELVGKSLWDALPTLRKLERMYGSHPAGEGGEYETLTLSSPLMSSRVSIVDSEVIVTDEEPNVVAYQKIHKAELVVKDRYSRPSREELRGMLGLPSEEEEGKGEKWLDNLGREALEDLRGRKTVEETLGMLNMRDEPSGSSSTDGPSADGASQGSPPASSRDVQWSKRGRWFAASTSAGPGVGSSIDKQLEYCFDSISSHLFSQTNPLSLPLHATHITLLLPSMSLFPSANAAYIRYFGISPPSRATVAVPLPDGVGVRVEVVGFDDLPATIPSAAKANETDQSNAIAGPSTQVHRRIGNRSALHVQSISYWAPANIGPYSQAITVNERIHVAGQVPLIPPTLALPLPDPAIAADKATAVRAEYELQSTLALQHLRKIIEVLRSPNQTGGGWTGWVESCVAWWAAGPAPARGGDDDDSTNGRDGALVPRIIGNAWETWLGQIEFDPQSPLLIVRASELPKGSKVEVQANLHTGRRAYVDPCGSDSPVSDVDSTTNDDRDDVSDDSDDDEPGAWYSSGSPKGSTRGDAKVWWEMCRAIPRGGTRGIFLFSDINVEPEMINEGLSRMIREAVAVRVYHIAGDENTSLRFIEGLFTSGSRSPDSLRSSVTLVPVLDIHDRLGRMARLALDVFGA